MHRSTSVSFSDDTGTSVRLRDERLQRNAAIEKKLKEMKSKLNDTNKPSAVDVVRGWRASVLVPLLSTYRRPVLVGLVAIVLGSVWFYRLVANDDRAR
jgi:hypothetical protein